MMKCSVFGCKNYGVHKFPSGKRLRRKWEEALCRPNFKSSVDSRLCDSHFKSDDYIQDGHISDKLGPKYLKPGVVPSVFPKTDQDTPAQSIMPNIKAELEDLETESADVGECRFCEAHGDHSNMMSGVGAERSNYFDMLLECFNIFLSSDSTPKSLICDECAARLRDARDFKQLVLRAQSGLRAQSALRAQSGFRLQGELRAQSELRANTVELEVSESQACDMDVDIKQEPLESVEPVEPVEPKDLEPDEKVTVKVEPLELDIVEHELTRKPVENTSDSENDINTPPDIMNAATIATNNLLPDKSRTKYEKAYKDFFDWRMNKRTTSMSEDVLLAYFEDLSKKFSSASLWTIYSMLKSTLNIKHQVDISKYYKLTTFLKRKSQGYKAKKAKTFSPEEINKFLNEAPDQLYLQSKVALVFGVMGACRRQELYNLQFSDVQILDKTISLTVRNTKTKTDRTFTVTGSGCDLCKKYMELRPKACSTSNFFVNYSAGKCTNQQIGINKFGALGKTIAKYLHLPNPEMYTGHCFRRTSATLPVDAGGDITSLKRHGDWRSTAVAEGYIDDSMNNKVNVSNQILNSIQNKEIININMASSSSTTNRDPTTQPGPFNISNCSNVNVNYNYYNK